MEGMPTTSKKEKVVPMPEGTTPVSEGTVKTGEVSAPITGVIMPEGTGSQNNSSRTGEVYSGGSSFGGFEGGSNPDNGGI
jgi:hypothetical protein